MAMVLRIRSRDGLERVRVENPSAATVSDLRSAIESQLQIPFHSQTLSADKNLLLAKNPPEISRFADMADPSSRLSALGLSHGSFVFLVHGHEGERSVPGGPAVTPAGSFGRKMTMDDLIARQTRVSRQETPSCASVSFDRSAADAFQRYVNDSLAFAAKRAGFMYGSVSPEDGAVSVDFIYEPPQRGFGEDRLVLLRDEAEERLVDAIAAGMGLRRVGLVFSQTAAQARSDYTLSDREVLLAAELHAESGLKEWVTAVVKLDVSDDSAAAVHFEAYQMSDTCVKLFKDGWFETEIGDGDDPKLSRLKKEVVVGVKDTKEIDNDFFLVVVKILDHQGPLSTTFPIENRDTPVTMRALKTHLDRTKNLSFVKRISDFHLLLFLSRFLDINADVPALTMCVSSQTEVPEGYKILIESMANT